MVTIYGNALWLNMVMYELCMVMYGLCMVMYGYVWLCMVIYGYVWLCMVMYGYVSPQKSIVFLPMKCPRNIQKN